MRKLITDKEWEDYYNEFVAGEIKVADIAKETEKAVMTVYNKFAKFGYIRKRSNDLDKNEFYKDYENGLTESDLVIKYNVTPTYVRHLIKCLQSKT